MISRTSSSPSILSAKVDSPNGPSRNQVIQVLALTLTTLLTPACKGRGSSEDEVGSTETGDSSDSEMGETGTEGVPMDMGTPVICGDGMVEEGEQCDLGSGNGADSNCTPECQFNVCGDGYAHVSELEECDDGNTSNADACVDQCKEAACGDSFLQQGIEECDDDNTEKGDGCSPDCEEQKILDLALGAHHTCAIVTGGKVECWGEGLYGQLGYGNLDTIGDDEYPFEAGYVDMGESTATQIVAGFAHTAVVTDDGGVIAWGYNEFGTVGYPGVVKIGDDETPASMGKVNVGSELTSALIAGEFHTCRLSDAGHINCWGDNFTGQLGYGNTDKIGDNENPGVVGNIPIGYLVQQISAGRYQTCALLEDDNMKCWGYGTNGALGYGNTQHIYTPAGKGPIPLGGTKVASISAGYERTCIMTPEGDAACFGANNGGQLGYGNTQAIGDNEPALSAGFINIGAPIRDIQASVSGNFTCAVTVEDEVQCWGLNAGGELGQGNTNTIGDNELPSTIPPVELGGPVKFLRVGSNHACAVLEDEATLKCWGKSDNGQLGLGNTNAIGDNEKPSSVDPVQVF